jgi:hypothetical protein
MNCEVKMILLSCPEDRGSIPFARLVRLRLRRNHHRATPQRMPGRTVIKATTVTLGPLLPSSKVGEFPVHAVGDGRFGIWVTPVVVAQNAISVFWLVMELSVLPGALGAEVLGAVRVREELKVMAVLLAGLVEGDSVEGGGGGVVTDVPGSVGSARAEWFKRRRCIVLSNSK